EVTVYVDNMFRPAQLQGRPAKWSHLFADTHEELMSIAAEMGLNPDWLQYPGTHREHFDVTTAKRTQALGFGAVPIAYPSGVAVLLEQRRAVCQCKRLADCTWPIPPGDRS
ncbi:MAG TPA: DUF4031 domain-containing protein, partial [Nocardioidaceae bacterium]|nr:DUF4031 domain-containing protein [Nocardioidaceae bacterium]